VNNNGGSSLGGLIFPLLLVGLLALLFLSQRRRSRAVQRVQHQLRPGMNVMTTAGLFAEVQAIDDDAVHLEIAPGVVCRFARAAVARVLDPPADEPMESSGGDFDGGPEDGPPPAAPAT
jgi:preprotein translocase subunit YajC